MQSKFVSPSSGPETTLEAEFQQIIRQQQRHHLGVKKQKLSTWLKQAGSALVDFLVGAQSLSIRSKCLPNGDIQWVVYDPVTNIRKVFPSEQAVRVWLEQRYTR